MRTVRQLLEGKSADVFSISPDAAVIDAIRMMAERRVGALLVMEGARLAGIISERDYARKVVLRGLASKDTKVGDLMTQNVLTVSPSQTVEEVMGIMTNNHIRHLPVVDHGVLAGIISIGDAVKSVMEQQQATIEQLAGYIAGGMST